MKAIYTKKQIPLVLRQLLVFNNICRNAKRNPNTVVSFSRHTALAFGVMYLQENKKYIAYGGMFEYAHVREDVIEQGVHHLPHDDYVMNAITIKRQAFTPLVTKPIALLWHWKKYIKNRSYTYLNDNVEHFFPVNDELEIDYPPHKYHERLVATRCLPLWCDSKLFITPPYVDAKGHLNPKGYPEKRLI